jgi:hypothetical protein
MGKRTVTVIHRHEQQRSKPESNQAGRSETGDPLFYCARLSRREVKK